MDKDRIVGAAKEIGGKIKGAAGDTVERDQLSVEGRVTEAKGTVQNLYGQAKDAVRDVADEAADLAGDALAKGRERLPEAETAYRQGAAALEGYAREAPLGVLLGAAAAGYVLAYLIHGRR